MVSLPVHTYLAWNIYSGIAVLQVWGAFGPPGLRAAAQVARPGPQAADSVNPGEGLKMYISNKFLDDVENH